MNELKMAVIEPADNGFTVTYPEAQQVEIPLPSPFVGIDDTQLEAMFSVQLAANSDGEEEWNPEKTAKRLQGLKERFAKLREEWATRTQCVWVIKMRRWQFPDLDSEMCTKALIEAHKAYQKLWTLIHQGVQFHGPNKPVAMSMPFGGM